MGISTETASKILQGEFRRFEDVSEEYNPEVFILYRRQTNEVDNYIYIIESFFIKDK